MKNLLFFLLLNSVNLVSIEPVKSHSIQILLGCPRTVSTAFEKAMISRGDFKVLHEPWESSYMYHSGFFHIFDKLPLQEYIEAKNYNEVKALIYRHSSRTPVFVKDLIWCMPDEFLNDLALMGDPNVHLAFIIRDPAKSIESYYHKSLEFTTPEETLKWIKRVFCYDALLKIASRYKQLNGVWPLVIESEMLCQQPEETLKKYCRYVGMEFTPKMLSWSEEMHEEWKHYGNWHLDAASSTGFFVPKRNESEMRFAGIPAQYIPELEKICDEQNSYYMELKQIAALF